MKSNKNVLADDTHMGAVTLYVKDFEVVKEYYIKGVGLEILEEKIFSLVLGLKKTPILILEKKDELTFPKPRTAGLYHTAVVFKTKRMLAQSLMSVFENYPESFEGSGDHLVSQAFYFHDPEGNGLELYFDRPRDEWQWQNGQIVMATNYIDTLEFIKGNFIKDLIPLDAHVGHVHLKVGNIQMAKEFYLGILGFELTAELPQPNPSAVFVSAGGYHHHLGLNTWESLGAQLREQALGLGCFDILVTTSEDIDLLEKRLKNKKILYKRDLQNISTQDPWGNRISIKMKNNYS